MLAWIKRWGWLVAFVFVAVLLIVLTAGTVRPNIKAEIAAAKADAKAEKLEAEVGHAEAVTKIENEYHETIAKLEIRQAIEAKRLRADPRALSRFLARAANGKG